MDLLPGLFASAQIT
jgi:hypothetical protein